MINDRGYYFGVKCVVYIFSSGFFVDCICELFQKYVGWW